MRKCLIYPVLIYTALAATLTIGHDMDTSVSLYDSESLLIQVKVPNTGWVGLGFGTSMYDADIFVLMYDDYGLPIVKDMTGQGHREPDEDEVNDYQLIEARRFNDADMTLFRVVRPLNPSNPKNPFLNKNTEINMVWAYMRFRQAPSYHAMNHGSFKIVVSPEQNQVSLVSQISYETKSIIFIVHGYIMWITWGALCLIQVIFVRWCRHWWKYGYIVHSVAGAITVIATLLAGYPDFVYHWRGPFSLIGLFFVSASGFLGLLGAFILIIIAFQKWKINVLLRYKAVHYYLGYLLIFLGQVLTFIGMESFRNFYPKDYLDLFYYHIAVFFAIVIGFEIFYQIYKRKETPFKREGLPVMKSDEFHKQVLEGRKLTIVEDLVLDITHYINKHPGGAFALEECVGRDASKFIYGAYNFEQNKGNPPYTHTNYARVIVNQLAIAFIDRKVEQTVCKITDSMDISMTTKIVTLQGDKPIFQTFYSDVSYIGKHYMIYPVENPKLKRQYTICNAMEEAVYENYILALTEALDGDEDCIDLTYEDDESEDFVIGIKNYFTKSGLATMIHDLDEETQFMVKGPMGHGLGIEEEGTHVAFCGGTGVFVFVDLVAHLIRKYFKQLSETEDKMLGKSFQFVLYASFPNRVEAYALELIENFDKLCKMNKWEHYDLQLRISSETKQRWDRDYISKQMLQIGNVKRVWVCGPPIMEDQFIRIFDEIGEKVGVTKQMIDIM